MEAIESLLLSGLALSGALMAQALLSRGVKALLWAWTPLACGETEACTYQRAVYRTADPALLPVVGLTLGAGVAWGVGLALPSMASPWLMLAGVLGVLVALVLDLQRWERVAASGNNLWFQRGMGHTVHQVAIGNIREVTVQESPETGPTLRRWRHNRCARLGLRMADKRVLALPKTDAFSGIEAVENMANFLRERLQQLHEAEQAQARKNQAVKPVLRQRDVSRPPSPSMPRPTPVGASAATAHKPSVATSRAVSSPASSAATPTVLATPTAITGPRVVALRHPGEPLRLATPLVAPATQGDDEAELRRALRRLRRPADAGGARRQTQSQSH
jgi:hypothetical protein